MPGLIRVIILGILIGVVLKLIKKFQQNRLEQGSKNSARSEKGASSKKTIRCDHCAIYVPAEESLEEGENNFCCLEHQQEYSQEKYGKDN